MKSPKPLVILPTSLPPETVKAVRAAGYIPILTDEPDKVRMISGQTLIDGSDLLMAALHGTTTASFSSPEHFANELYRRFKVREETK